MVYTNLEKKFFGQQSLVSICVCLDCLINITCLFRYILSGNHYQDSLKGMICAKTNITQMIYDDQTKIELSNKPFLILIILTSIVYGFVIYYFIVALRQRLRDQPKNHIDFDNFRKLHSIRTLQINLMDLRQHFIFCNLFIYRLFLDQGLNLFIQTYYKELGSENAFTIWWIFFYFENVGKRKKWYLDTSKTVKSGLRFIFSMKVYFNARRRLQEFSGLRGRRFPGQESPRPPTITPWRPNLPPEFSEEWSRIGSRRRPKTVTIFVTPSDVSSQ